MSSPEVEKFEITDYDIDNEFNIDRPRRRQTKNDAIYGSFAGDDSDDDDWGGRPGLGGAKKNYSSGINFISGGIKKSAKEEAAEVEGRKEDDPDMDNMDPLLQEQFAKPKQKPQKQRRGFKQTPGSGSKGIGDWERNTNAIGSKLLMMMGWKPGEGVGRDGRGIATPVEAVLRKGKGAIGFYGTERTERSLKDFPVKDEEAEDDAKFKEQLNQWKRTETGKKKPNYVYKTADELIAKGTKRKVKEVSTKSKHSQVKVIDMTGKEQRVLSGYHAISTKKHDSSDDELAYSATQPGEKRAFEMPELLHNLNMLIDMTEEEIITKDRQLRYERDMTVNMQHESERLEALCTQEEKQLKRLSDVLSLIDTFEERTKPDAAYPLSLDECADLFLQLQESYYEEYKMYDLITLSIAVVFPLMQRYFAGWQPLSDPKYGCDVMKRWKSILDTDRRHGDSTTTYNAYSKMVWDVWMPHLRTAISLWNVRNPDALIEVLETWMHMIPSWMFQNVLDQLVNPKLQMEVDKWNPLTDTMPIHAWLHPWLPLMGSRLEPLYAPIRHKLASALTKWHPSDGSAKLMLRPWFRVFSPGHTEAFLTRNIVPKLALCLQEMVINPANQNMENWKWVMSWQDVLSDQVLVNLLDKCFFQRWLQTLVSWLNTSPNYEEIAVWYKGWKSVIPERLHTHPLVKDKLNIALNMMNHSVTNPSTSVSLPPMPPPQVMNYNGASNTPPLPHPAKAKMMNSDPVAPALNNPSTIHTFKDLVAMKASEENLQFFPLPGKTHEARQVYQCGRLQISIDRGVIFVQTGINQWTPVSLNQLMQQAAE